VRIETGEKKERMAFDEDLLFTHRGLSGPAVLQISSYWREGHADPHRPGARRRLAAGAAAGQGALAQADRQRARAWVPSRLADAWVQQDPGWQRPVNEASDKALLQLANAVALGAGADRQRGLPQGRSHGRRRRHARAVVADHGSQRSPACISSARWWT
jgi:predicted flavoprotein YhiN